MDNAQIAAMLDELADLSSLEGGNPFRVRSFRRGARVVRNCAEAMTDLVHQGKDLTALPGIGTSIAEIIAEIAEDGTSARLEELRQHSPQGLDELLRIPGLGPERARRLHRELGIGTRDELRRACEQGRLRELDGFGAKTEARLLRGLAVVEMSSGRMLRHEADAHVAHLGQALDGCTAIERWQVSGSYRRQVETVGDLDILVIADDRAAAADAIVATDGLGEIIERGHERLSLRLERGPQVDVRFVESDHFGAAQLYFTGSKAHNIAVRKRANQRHWKLSEYGLFSGDDRIAGAQEAEIYQRLDLDWIPPELREDHGEVAAAAAHRLPTLVTRDALRGDLQCHSTASDGADSIRAMAEAARDLGHDFLAITDHGQGMAMVGGLDEDRARRQVEEIRDLDDELNGISLFAGIEVDIHKNGDLALDASCLHELDWVLGALHSHLDLDRTAMTDRLIRAIASGAIDAVAHPTARQIGKRGAIDADWDAVFTACADHQVRMEINAQPQRLDLPDDLVRLAYEHGVLFTLGTDAHATGQLALIDHAVAVARRGWLPPDCILNTGTAKQVRKAIAASRRVRRSGR